METTSKKQKTGAANANGTANGQAETSSNTSMPATYPALDTSMTFDERLRLLGDEAICDCKPCEVEQGFEYYIGEYVQSEDWQAVWQSRRFGCDVLVEVIDVRFPDAKVKLVEPFCCQPNSLGDFKKAEGDDAQLKTKNDLTKFLSDGKGKVPLIELVPVRDESGFFYTHIWRLSDEFGPGGDYMFVGNHLYPRMMLYYDVQTKKASKPLINSYNKIMSEYNEKYLQFRIKYDKGGEDVHALGMEVSKVEKQLEKLTYKHYKGY